VLSITHEDVLASNDNFLGVCVPAEEEGLRLVEQGCARRHTNETLMNAESSRSHAVLMVYIESRQTEESGLVSVRYSRLNLVDLAGELAMRDSQTPRFCEHVAFAYLPPARKPLLVQKHGQDLGMRTCAGST
jgi:hypothetical protein